jgi:hypothetical protein
MKEDLRILFAEFGEKLSNNALAADLGVIGKFRIDGKKSGPVCLSRRLDSLLVQAFDRVPGATLFAFREHRDRLWRFCY